MESIKGPRVEVIFLYESLDHLEWHSRIPTTHWQPKHECKRDDIAAVVCACRVSPAAHQWTTRWIFHVRGPRGGDVEFIAEETSTRQQMHGITVRRIEDQRVDFARLRFASRRRGAPRGGDENESARNRRSSLRAPSVPVFLVHAQLLDRGSFRRIKRLTYSQAPKFLATWTPYTVANVKASDAFLTEHLHQHRLLAWRMDGDDRGTDGVSDCSEVKRGGDGISAIRNENDFAHFQCCCCFVLGLPALNLIPTDGLVLRGSYTTVTLAVYGNLAPLTSHQLSANHDEELPVSSTPTSVQDEKNKIRMIETPRQDRDQEPLKVEACASFESPSRGSLTPPVRKERELDDVLSSPKQSDSRSLKPQIGSDLASEDGRSIGEGMGSDRLDTPEPPRCSSEKTISPHSISGDIGSSHKAPGVGVLKPLSPGEIEAISEDEMEVDDEEEKETSGTSIKGFSGDEKQGGQLTGIEEEPPLVGEVEEILSEDDLDYEQDLDMEYYPGGDGVEDLIKQFNPYAIEIVPMVYLEDPSLSECENATRRLLLATPEEGESEKPKAAQRLLLLVESFPQAVINDKWVDAMENAAVNLPQGLAYLLHHAQSSAVLDTLLEWIDIGLDFDKALKQELPAYMVRHMKGGVRLAQALCSCNRVLARRLLSWGIQERLLDLYGKPHMGLPLKLMILKALDATTSTKLGLDLFLGRVTRQRLREDSGCGGELGEDFTQAESDHDDEDEDDDDVLTPYQILLKLLFENCQGTRAKVAIMRLLQKTHFYELLTTMTARVEALTEDILSMQLPTADGTSDSDGGESSPQQVEVKVKVPSSDIDLISSALLQLLKVYKNAGDLIAQPGRILPATSQFTVPSETHDPYFGLFCMFQSLYLLESMLTLLTCPSTASNQAILSRICDFLLTLLQSQRGILYLSANGDTTTALIKMLVNLPFETPDDSVFNPQQIGLQMAFNLHVLKQLDCLFVAHNSPNKQVDDPDFVQALSSLHSLLFSHHGRLALINTIPLADNVLALLPFFELGWKKSACRGYATDILATVVKFSDSVLFLEMYGQRLLELSRAEDVPPAINALSSWLTPVDRAEYFGYDEIPSLCEVTKKLLDGTCISSNGALSPGLCTCLRILCFLSREPDQSLLASQERHVQLKYKYAIVQMFSGDLLQALTSAVTRMATQWEQPSAVPSVLVSTRGIELLLTMKSTIELMRRLLAHVIEARGTEFTDLSAVVPLLQAHTLASAYPNTCMAHWCVGDIQRNVVGALLTYTQPVLEAEESEEKVGKSLWTQMLKELLTYILSAPFTYIPCLQVLCDLLPLPLPIQTIIPLSEEDESRALSHRKLWTAHLYCLAPLLSQVIGTLCTSSSTILQSLLRRAATQLADLAPTMALLVARCAMDIVLKLSAGDQPPVDSSAAEKALVQAFSFLGTIIGAPPVKVAVLQTTRTEEKFQDFVGILTKVLVNHGSKPNLPECVISILQTLCDTEVAICTDAPLNFMPPSEQLNMILDALLTLIGDSGAGYSQSAVIMALRTLVMITDSDYGVYSIFLSLKKNPAALLETLERLSLSFNRENSDHLSILSTVLELVRLLAQLDPEPLGPSPLRTKVLSPHHLREVLSWDLKKEQNQEEKKAGNETEKEEKDGSKGEEKPTKVEVKVKVKTGQSIFQQLRQSLVELNTQDSSLKGLITSIDGLVSMLEEKSFSPAEMPEPHLGEVKSLSSQMLTRPVSVVIKEVEEERLSRNFWMGSHIQMEEDDPEGAQQVEVDLVALCSKYLTDMDLAKSLSSWLHAQPLTAETVGVNQTTISKLNPSRGKLTQVNTPRVGIRGRKPYGASRRGGNFSRRGMGTGDQDRFRRRLPNTSRPPSMHVDDFLALESKGKQPTGPTGYNPSTKQAFQALLVNNDSHIRTSTYQNSMHALPHQESPAWDASTPRKMDLRQLQMCKLSGTDGAESIGSNKQCLLSENSLKADQLQATKRQSVFERLDPFVLCQKHHNWDEEKASSIRSLLKGRALSGNLGIESEQSESMFSGSTTSSQESGTGSSLHKTDLRLKLIQMRREKEFGSGNGRPSWQQGERKGMGWMRRMCKCSECKFSTVLSKIDSPIPQYPGLSIKSSPRYSILNHPPI
ncbi:unnamed protein product [Darwinula stevensoni]|uniref:Virilizer N-terminal domain-containing protein n=1 Tax=Darwinula stevensoni TaxID=69355 RepID=A0A7R8XCC6_9CRUS|nr:unnamed protein product [Darwinula stevensoni]CAG0888692.1 unnamed protein product [Darwinula stevensoni]